MDLTGLANRHALPALSASDRDTLTISQPVSLLLARVPAGQFLMGSVVARDPGAGDRESPTHTVHVPEYRPTPAGPQVQPCGVLTWRHGLL